MPTITDELVLDISQPLRQFDQLESSLNESVTSASRLTSEMGETASATDRAAGRMEDFETRLQEAERSAARLVTETTSIAGSAGTAEVNFRDLAKALNISEDAARGLTQKVIDAQAAGNRVEDAARGIARQLSLSDDEARDFVRSLERADVEADQVAASTSRIAGGFATLRSSALGLVAGFGAFTAIRAAVGLAGDARVAFADLEDSVNAVKVVFGEASVPILAFGENVAQTAGLSMAEFNQTAAVLGSSLLNVGFGADEAARKTIDLTQRAADMASIFGGPVSTAIEAILSALRGESNPIERFGVTLTAAKVAAEAADLGFKKVNGEFDSTAKTAAILNIIMRETQRTAGDFANTAEDLANATKIASAEFVNAKASLGEALLPVFQALLAATPEVLGAIEDLVPALNALAVSAGQLFVATPGVLDFVDALHLVTDISRGFGQVGDNARAMVETFGAGSNAIAQAFTGNFFGAVTTVIAGVKGLGDELQNTLERQNTQGLIDDLREGGDAADSLASRLADVGKRGKLDANFVKGLIQIAGADVGRTSAALKQLIGDAERLGLATDDVTALRGVWLELNEEIVTSPRVMDNAAAALGGFVDEVPVATTALGNLQQAASDIGVSLTDLVLGLDPLAAAMTSALTPSQNTALALLAVTTEGGAAAAILANNLRPAIIDVSSAFVDLNEDGRVTTAEFVENANTMRTAALQLAADLSAIATFDPATALELSKLPADQAAQLIADFAADPEGLALALFGPPELLGQSILDIYVGALAVLQGGNQQAINSFIAFTAAVTEKSVPGVTAAMKALFDPALAASFADLDVPDLTPGFTSSIDGMNAAEITASLDDKLGFAFEDLTIPDLTPLVIEGIERWNSVTISAAVTDALFANVDIDLEQEGIQSRATYLNGLSTPQPGEISRLRNSITSTLDSAVYADSPPKLFIDRGKDAGSAYWSGFGTISLRAVPQVPAPAGPGPGTGPSQVTNFTNQNIINNPVARDILSESARLEQLTGAVTANLRGF